MWKRKLWLNVQDTLVLIVFSHLFVTFAKVVSNTSDGNADEGEGRSPEVDFSCMFGRNADQCKEGLGNSRFSTRNVSETDCSSADEFLTTDEIERSISVDVGGKKEPHGKKIFVCGSFFEWVIQEDTEDPIQSDFKEEHFCLHDTPHKIHIVKREISSDCFKKETERNKLLAYEKICICKKGNNCNSNFRANFKEPKEVHSLCQTTRVELDELPSKTNQTSSSFSIMPQFWVLFCSFIIIIL